MARKDRGSPINLIEQLTQYSSRFSFIQAVRLLRLLIRNSEPSATEQELENRIRVRPELSFDFPGTDITHIERIDSVPERFLITVTFLGLYGASSPLPAFYTEDLLHEREDDRSITRDFLDIINMPLYPLFFKGWAKYQIPYKIIEELDHETLQRLYSLIGLESEIIRQKIKDPYHLLRYMGLVTQFPRSAEGLRVLLSDALGIKDLRIIQCVTRLAIIPEDQRLRLGQSGNILGKNSYLGIRIHDRMGKFRVQIKDADGDILHRFLPDQEAFNEMKELVRFYLDRPFEWDLQITLASGRVEHACLGSDRWSKLGWNTWLFSGPPPQVEMSVRLNPGGW